MSELQHIVSKVHQHCTYTNTANYWALHEYKDGNDKSNKESHQAIVNNISKAEVQCNLQSTIMAWINQRMNQHKPFQQKASTMVVNSGTTSSFVGPDENLPIFGPSIKIVNVPNGSSIKATHTTMLPFESILTEARKPDVQCWKIC